jgi:hypothetical protein
MSKIMTPAEWFKQNNSHRMYAVTTPTLEEITAYAAYYHAEMSKPPKDVEDAAINWCNSQKEKHTHADSWDNMYDSFIKGYSLANKPPKPNS